MTMEDAWGAALRAAQVTTRETSPPTARGAWCDDTGWHVSLPEHTQVDFGRDADDHFNLLADAWSDEEGLGLPDGIGKEEILHEVARHAGWAVAEDRLHGTATPDWPTAFASIGRGLSVAVAGVPIGGVFNSEVDARGNARPVSIGNKVVVGHLDDSLEEAVRALALSAGLPGFRFTEESWWTEDFISVQEDDEVDGYVSLPWLVAAWVLPVAGDATGMQQSSAPTLRGAVVLLDHSPGTYWGRFLPWMPAVHHGQGTHSADAIDSDNTIICRLAESTGWAPRRRHRLRCHHNSA
jgi:hypothetical protein